MALPTIIATDAQPRGGRPFMASSGAAYIVLLDDTNWSQMRAYKATDPSVSWSNVGTNISGTGGNRIWAYDVEQVGDVLYVVTLDAATAAGSANIRYHVFDMATDSWTTSSQIVASAINNAISAEQHLNVSIVRHADGKTVILYPGERNSIMGTAYARVSYAIMAAGGSSFTIGNAVDDAGSISYYVGSAIGVDGRTHFFYYRGTSSVSIDTKTLSATGTLSASQLLGGASEAVAAKGKATVYTNSSAQKRVVYPYRNTNGSAVVAEFTSVDSSISSAVRVIASSYIYPPSVVSHGTTVWAAFFDPSTNGMLVYSSVNGAAFQSLTTYAAIADQSLPFNVFTRPEQRVLAFVNTENSLVSEYDEYVVASLAVILSGSATVGATATGALTVPREAISTLTDAFESGLDTANWTLDPGSDGSASVVNGELVLSPNSWGDVTVRSTKRFKFLDDSISVRWVAPGVTTAADDSTYGSALILESPSASYYVEVYIDRSGVIWSQPGTVPSAVPYDAAQMAWLRLREASGTTYWETAPATANDPPLESEWVVRHSAASQPGLDDVRVGFSISSGLEVPNVVKYDAVNTSTLGGPAPHELAGALTVNTTGTAALTLPKPLEAAPTGAVQGTAALTVDVKHLVEDFESPLDAQKWTATEGVAFSGGTGRLTVSSVATTVEIYSKESVSLMGSSAYFRLVDAPQPTGAWVGVGLAASQGVGSSRRTVSVGVGDEGTLYVDYRVGGVDTQRTFAYSPTNHAWLRIRESAGTAYIDAAPLTASNPPQESDWAVVDSLVGSFDLRQATVNFWAYGDSGYATPVTFVVDGLNTASSEINLWGAAQSTAVTTGSLSTGIQLASTPQAVAAATADLTVPPPTTLSEPRSDISAGGWVPSSGSDLYAMVDESVASDADYISASSPTVCVLKLGTVLPPAGGRTCKLSYRAQSSSGGTLTARLKQGSTVIATATHAAVAGTATDYSMTLTSAEKNAITDFNDLSIELEAA